MCKFRVSLELFIHARWFAENDSKACMTNGYEEAMLRNLTGRHSQRYNDGASVGVR